jgi:hypothetical protein
MEAGKGFSISKGLAFEVFNIPLKGVKNNTNFGQITGIQEKLATTCK